MIVKKRQIDLLKDVLKSREIINYTFLRNKYSISDRTIRYDLKEVDEYLKSKNLPPLTRSKTKGIYLDLPPVVLQQIVEEINKINGESYVLNSEERLQYILFFLLQKDEPISIEQIAKEIKFSRNTIVEDIKNINIFLQGKACRLVKKRRIGMYLEISEFQRRQLVIDLFANYFNIGKWELVWGKVNGIGKHFQIVLQNELKNLFRNIELKRLNEFMEDLQGRMKRKYTDDSIDNMILALALSKKRCSKEKFIELQTFHLKTIKLSEEYKILKERLEKNGDILEKNENEIAYIAMHMLSNKIIQQENESVFGGHTEEVKEITKKMIDILEGDLKVKLEEQERQKLYKGLILHLEPAIYRMRYNIGISNKLLKEIKEKYKKYYDVASKACRYLSQRVHIIVPEEEIGFFALYFGATMEGHKDKNIVKILVVCNAGMSTVSILEARLEEEFQNIEIMGHLSYSDYLKLENINADIIVSTIEIQSGNVPVVVVNPLINENDVIRLQKKLS